MLTVNLKAFKNTVVDTIVYIQVLTGNNYLTKYKPTSS